MRPIRNKDGFLKSFIDRQVRAWKHEDIAYRAAFLGRMRNAVNNYRYKENKFPSSGIITYSIELFSYKKIFYKFMKSREPYYI